MITCMKMKSFMPSYASIIIFYHVNLACYQLSLHGLSLHTSMLDSSEGEDNRGEGEEASEEVNLCLMAKSSEGEVSIDDISNEELSNALADLLCTFRITRRELRKSKQENLKLVETISFLNERLEKASSSPIKEDEYIRKLGEENTKLERENIMLKGKLNSLESSVSHMEEKISPPNEYCRLKQRYDPLLGSQKSLEMLLGS